jgi:hypothetical protein
MKIVDYNTFISMPKGTLYSNYAPCYMSGLKVKDDTINEGKDWFYYDMLDNPDQHYKDEYLQYFDTIAKMEHGESIPADFYILERDGMFDYERCFVIYEHKDIKEFIEKLKELIHE